MEKITLNAWAKVNFSLKILGKMPNGYHRLESFMQSVGLCDEVSVSLESIASGMPDLVVLDPGRPDLPSDAGNLAYKAAVLMHDEFRSKALETAVIKITKRIPVAAGLAGGSADGAAVIAALSLLYGLSEKDGEGSLTIDAKTLGKLCELASKLGSDVPFCLMNHFGVSAAIAAGTGTEIKKAESIKCTLAMITPAMSVSTKAVYGELAPSDYAAASQISALKLAEPGLLSEKIAYMGNDLEAPALRLFPKISETLGVLASLGPKPLYVQLSGSGPTCFAILGQSAEPEISRLEQYAEDTGAFFTICCTRT